MAKIFVSFLGTGALNKDPGYDRATYNWPGKSATTVTACFAQTAILKILEEKAADEGPVDKVIFLCTEESEINLSGYAVCSTTHHRLWLSTNQNFTGSRGAIYSLFHQPIEQ